MCRLLQRGSRITWKVRVAYLGCRGDLVSSLMMGVIGVPIWVIGVINLLTKSP